MNLITRFLPLGNVLLDIDVSSKKRVFEQFGLLFENNNKIALGAVFESLFAREKLGSTGLGYGVAIPHGRIKSLRETVCAFVRTRAGVPFEAPDGVPVRLIFAILVPAHANEQHLQILSELAQMFSDSNFRETLLQCNDNVEAHRLLTQWSPYASAQRTAII